MDPKQRFSERSDRDWKEHWWFPAGLGLLALAILFATTTEGIRPNLIQVGLAAFGSLMTLLDGFGTWQMFSRGTLLGPPERESEASARFYAWERASRRYLAAILLSVVAPLSLRFSISDDAQLGAVLVPFGLYFIFWGTDVARSLKEAKALFPPPAR